MRTTLLTMLRNLGGLLQKAGPYLLIELVLPGGTLIAFLLFLYQRRGSFDGIGAPLPFAAAVTTLGEAVEVVLPGDIASVWRGRGRERDGLEALAMAPTM